jgi:hypothetical protein
VSVLHLIDRRLKIIGVWLFCLILIILRNSDVIVNAQPWAEDGRIFITDSLLEGWNSILRPYAGYLHLIPRLTTIISVHLSIFLGKGISLVPFFMNSISVLISVSCVVFLCHSRFDWIASFKHRALVSILIIVIPYTTSGEIFGSITNSQWWLSYIQFLIAWEILHKNKLPSISNLILLIVTSLTGPLGVIPFLAMLIVYLRNFKKNFFELYYSISMLVISALVAIQMIISMVKRVSITNHENLFEIIYINLPRLFFSGILSRNILIDYKFVLSKESYSTSVLIGSVLILVLIILYKQRYKDLLIPGLILFIYMAMVYKGSPDWYKFYSIPYTNGAGRYLFLPTSIFLTVFIAGLTKKLRVDLLSSICILILVLILITDINNFKFPKLNDYNWIQTTKNFDLEGSNFCESIINPGESWKVKYPCEK